MRRTGVAYARPCSQRERLLCRSTWLARCFELTGNCDLVFFDPDNGLEIASVPKHHPKAGKYIYWDELVPFWNRGHALLIYHHLNRTASAARQIQSLKLRFAATFDRAEVLPLVFRRGSSRVFWLVHRGDALGAGIRTSSRRSLEHRLVSTFPAVWLAKQRSGKHTCRLTVHHLTRSDAEPINATTDACLDHLNESSGFGCQGPVAYPWIDVVQMVQDYPSGLVRLYRAAHDLGIEPTHATEPCRYRRQLPNVLRNPGLSGDMFPGGLAWQRARIARYADRMAANDQGYVIDVERAQPGLGQESCRGSVPARRLGPKTTLKKGQPKPLSALDHHPFPRVQQLTYL